MTKSFQLFIAVVLLFFSVVFAGEAEDNFNMLFGSQVKKAKASRTRTDDVKVAKDLLKAGQQMSSNPKVAVICLETAVELGATDPDGYETAIEAGNAIKDTYPDQASKADGLLMPIYENAYRRAKRDDKPQAAADYFNALMAAAEIKVDQGDAQQAIALYRKSLLLTRYVSGVERDDITERIRAVADIVRVNRTIKTLKQKLMDNPSDSANAKELTKLLLVDKGDVKEAAQYAKFSGDAELKSNLELAAKDPSSLTDMQAFKLAAWFEQLAADTNAVAKLKLLSQAKTYYQTFKAKHTDSTDMFSTKANLALAKLEKVEEYLITASMKYQKAVIELILSVNKINDSEYEYVASWTTDSGGQDSKGQKTRGEIHLYKRFGPARNSLTDVLLYNAEAGNSSQIGTPKGYTMIGFWDVATSLDAFGTSNKYNISLCIIRNWPKKGR